MILTNAKRIGQFDVSLLYYCDLENRQDDGLELLFEHMIVLSAIPLQNHAALRYIAVHPAFRNIREGEIPPTYQALFFSGDARPFWLEQRESFGPVKPPPDMRCPPAPMGGVLEPLPPVGEWRYIAPSGKEWIWTEALRWRDPTMPMFRGRQPAWGWRAAWREIRGWFGGQG